MKKVRHNGRVLDKFSLCSFIDHIHYSYAVVFYDYNNYNYWRDCLLTTLEKYAPHRIPEFTNLY